LTSCEQDCNFGASCGGGRTVDSSCQCSCPNKDEMTPENLKPYHTWNLTSCGQDCTNLVLPGYKKQNPITCEPECIDSCPPNGCPYENQEWCEDTCSVKV
jgi:hypothetical protein